MVWSTGPKATQIKPKRVRRLFSTPTVACNAVSNVWGRPALDIRLEVNEEHRPAKNRATDSANPLAPTLAGRTGDRVVPLICEINSTRAEGLKLESIIFVTG